MTRGKGFWDKFRSPFRRDFQDDDKIAAYLAKQDLCVTIREILRGDLPLWDLARALRSSIKASYYAKVGLEHVSSHLASHIPNFTNSLARSTKDTKERLTDKVLLRSFALFVGSVIVIQNYGKLVAV
ncbi:unnamed protein product [Calypogeia fissa]